MLLADLSDCCTAFVQGFGAKTAVLRAVESMSEATEAAPRAFSRTRLRTSTLPCHVLQAAQGMLL